MLKAAIYCRLSEEDRNKKNETDDSGSIQNQKAMLLEYAAQHSWEVYNIYSDDYTGSDRNRPAFTRMLEDAESHRFDIILCKSQSRFIRELELVEKYINGLFPLWGIRFISLVDNADTSNKGNKKARQINSLVNEWYLEDMSENIRAVLTNRRKSGFHIGAFAPYGYKKDPEQKGHLLIDEEAAAVVREIFALFSQGYGKAAIARLLNERGIPNPTEYKRLHGLRYQQPRSKTSTLWKYAAVFSMLSNELYIGNMVQGEASPTRPSRTGPGPRKRGIVWRGPTKPSLTGTYGTGYRRCPLSRPSPFAAGPLACSPGRYGAPTAAIPCVPRKAGESTICNVPAAVRHGMPAPALLSPWMHWSGSSFRS